MDRTLDKVTDFSESYPVPPLEIFRLQALHELGMIDIDSCADIRAPLLRTSPKKFSPTYGGGIYVENTIPTVAYDRRNQPLTSSSLFRPVVPSGAKHA